MGIERFHVFARQHLLTPFGLCLMLSVLAHGLILALPERTPQAPVRAAGAIQARLLAQLTAVQVRLSAQPPVAAQNVQVVQSAPSPVSRLPERRVAQAQAERLPSMAKSPEPRLTQRVEAAPPAAAAVASAAVASNAPATAAQGSAVPHASLSSPVAAPLAAPATPPASAAAPRDVVVDPLAEYRGQLAALLNRPRDYPPVAAMRGWEGEVRLRVRIARKGNLLAVSLERSSGFGVLDQHALAALERQGDFPPLPERWEGSEMQLVVPIHYRLRKTI